jgi:hypothetical protein
MTSPRERLSVGGQASVARSVRPTKRERFFASAWWLVLRNILGWLLIIASFVAGPLVPGPGGIPLFLIGFALISFPGKRQLTARVLRGRQVHFKPGTFVLICLAAAIALPALVLTAAKTRPRWLACLPQATAANILLYLLGVVLVWLLARQTSGLLNLLLRMVPRARGAVRRWLRRHRIHLLPPRWRPRRPHEPGAGAFRLTDEILKFRRRAGEPCALRTGSPGYLIFTRSLFHHRNGYESATIPRSASRSRAPHEPKEATHGCSTLARGFGWPKRKPELAWVVAATFFAARVNPGRSLATIAESIENCRHPLMPSRLARSYGGGLTASCRTLPTIAARDYRSVA